MRTAISRWGMGRVLCFVASLMTFTSTFASAQTNAWINPGSGSWDDATSWSLGSPPGNSQTVMITNSGFKAVAINPSTPVNSPNSMTVGSLTIQGYTNTDNTLLLNFFGTSVPLTVLNGLTLQDNAQILNLSSSIIVQGGTITVTNSQINQDGGYIGTLNAPMFLQSSVVNVTNGLFQGGTVNLGMPSPADFNQYGGTVIITNLVFAGGPSFTGGHYALYGGLLSLPSGLTIINQNNESSSYLQEGGTNQTTTVLLEAGNFGSGPAFTLDGGLLADNEVRLPAGFFGSVTLTQNGGTHIITNSLYISGATHSLTEPPDPGTYQLNGGTLSAGSMNLDATDGPAVFNQTNGTAQIAEIQGNSGGPGNSFWVPTVTLSGGTLSCADLFITDGGEIQQSGGALTVSNTLSVVGYFNPGPTNYTEYDFFGGTLFANNINIGGNWIIGDGASPISNPGTCSLSHALTISNATEQLGGFILASNATIDLAGSASKLSFANSSGQAWAGGATLVVADWNGNSSGGGAEQLKFGTDQTGLTTAQLNQIHFSIGTNLYTAKILNTGEVVPNQGGPSSGGQTNSWVNAASGNWEDAASWSLGVPPGAGQAVMITNSGFKAVAIQSSTTSGFPQTLSVNAVTITSPTNSANTLLMNFAGAGSPLVIGVDTNTPGSLVIGDTNSTMTMFSSGLIVNNTLETNNSRIGEFEVDGTFNQSDGSEVIAGFLNLNGTYNLTNGNLFVNNQFINGRFTEQGGTNLATSVALNGTGGYYDLAAGTLNTQSLTLSNAAAFDQFGGDDTNGAMILTGTTNQLGNPVTAVYTFNGGTLETPSLTMNIASFNHYAGNDSIGTLSMSNLPSSYVINSGSLAVNQILLSAGAAFYHTTGALIGTRNVTLASGNWIEQGSGVQLGQLQLASGANSGIALTSGSCVLKFADSSSVPWAGDGRLSIQNWSGSLSGGGSEQLFFGTSASGLTAQQLSQVQFNNPAGLPTGTYSAQILSDGEVVPGQLISTSGQVNSWINPASGNWDDATSWSLGVLPNSSQLVMITNSGTKEVIINASTPTNFPSAMTVSNLTIQGSATTENTLLLNNFGTGTPLTVLNGLTLQDNAQILNLNSALVVQSGTITVTNSQISQDGGFINTTNAQLNLFNAEYDLTNGVLQAGAVQIGLGGPSHINQYGGVVTIAALSFPFFSGPASGDRGYVLHNGMLNLPGGLSLEGEAGSTSSYFQDGGTNRTTDIVLEPGLSGPSPNFTLNGGLLADNNVSIFADTIFTDIQQNGGNHSISNVLQISGGARTGVIRPALYQLNAGTLSAGTIALNSGEGTAMFVQSNGIAQAGQIQASGEAFLGSYSQITLAGGTLSCSNLSWIDGGLAHESGGALVVSNLLSFGGVRVNGGSITNYSRYELVGGTVAASNITAGGDWVIGDGANRITNPGTFSLSHGLIISNATEQLGHFILASNAVINFAGSASQLSFANSSGQAWAGGASLLISNWNGSTSGNGAEQLKYGTDQTGLTAAQLKQMWFRISTNLYSAKILNTGEVVPNQVVAPPLDFSAQGNNLVLSWLPGYTLQSSTNVTGPYTTVSGATSPYTNNMTLAPQMFFKLAP